jgi:hypothetical protein
VQKSKWTGWIELAAALSVLIGLIFVAMEIRQSNDHARAESIRDLYQMWSNIYQFEYENDILLLVRKSIEKPDELSEGDYLRLGKYLDLVMNAQLAQATMQVEGGLVVGEVESEAPEFARSYFSSKASRSWLRANEGWISSYGPAFYSALIDEIEKNPVATKMPQLEGFESRR